MKEEESWRKRSKEEEGNGLERIGQKGLGRMLKTKTQEPQLPPAGPVWSASLTAFWKNSFCVSLPEVVVLFLVHNSKRNEGRKKGEGMEGKEGENLLITLTGKKHKYLDWAPTSHDISSH